jgi:hypothetical protein
MPADRLSSVVCGSLSPLMQMLGQYHKIRNNSFFLYHTLPYRYSLFEALLSM